MVSITKATEGDCNSIVDIGKISVEESHRGSSSDEVMNAFLEKHYSHDAIKGELLDSDNVYYIIRYNDQAAGFSKMILNSGHPNIAVDNVTKLDRIYLLKEYYGMKLGLALLNFNIEVSKNNDQSGMWLYAWIGNKRAVQFYQKAGFTVMGSHKYYVTETHYDVSHHMFLNYQNR